MNSNTGCPLNIFFLPILKYIFDSSGPGSVSIYAAFPCCQYQENFHFYEKTLCLMNTLYTKCLIITGCSNSFAKFGLKYEQLLSRIIFHFFSIWNFQSQMAQRKLDTLHLCGKTAMQINNLTFVSLNNTQSINHTEVLCLQLKLMILIVAIPHIV